MPKKKIEQAPPGMDGRTARSCRACGTAIRTKYHTLCKGDYLRLMADASSQEKIDAWNARAVSAGYTDFYDMSEGT
jgi:hypothetical protein